MGKKRGRKRLDLTGQQFGFLTVVEPLEERARDGSVMWRCLCECGKETTVSSNKLRLGHTRSCGCQKMVNARKAKHYVDGTCVEIILSEKVAKNNSSGYRGVAKRKDRWQAYITFRGKQKGLGVYDTIEEAVAARRQAEEEIRVELSMVKNGDMEMGTCENAVNSV